MGCASDYAQTTAILSMVSMCGIATKYGGYGGRLLSTAGAPRPEFDHFGAGAGHHRVDAAGDTIGGRD
jgi:hypothetical protein